MCQSDKIVETDGECLAVSIWTQSVLGQVINSHDRSITTSAISRIYVGANPHVVMWHSGQS